MYKKVTLALALMNAMHTYSHEGHHHRLYDEIHTDQLKHLIDSNQTYTIIDARTEDQDDKQRLPGAQFLPFNKSDQEIAHQLPLKEKAVIVYSTHARSRESTFLAERLATLGYTHIYKYSEGIHDWIKKGYSIDYEK